MASRHLAALALTALVLAGCGAAPDQSSTATPSATAGAAPSALASVDTDDRTVIGTLGGDAQLEGGCVWIETADGRIEPTLPEGYEVTTDPIALVGPDGEPIAEEGDEVAVTGHPATNTMTTCQVGEVWQVTNVTTATGG